MLFCKGLQKKFRSYETCDRCFSGHVEAFGQRLNATLKGSLGSNKGKGNSTQEVTGKGYLRKEDNAN